MNFVVAVFLSLAGRTLIKLSPSKSYTIHALERNKHKIKRRTNAKGDGCLDIKLEFFL